jgi:L-lactate dehydrogenase complex protein LldG
MSDRAAILTQLRAIRVAPADAPDAMISRPPLTDPIGRFTAMLEAAAGRVVMVEAEAPLSSAITAIAADLGATRVRSEIGELTLGDAPRDARQSADLEMVIAAGDFAVAENGAVWVRGGSVSDRSVLFLAQHLVLVVAAESIVADMHEAYARVDLVRDDFGVFIAGPSKTADIEQSLVIGAHGPRSLTVILRRSRTVSSQP